MTCARKVKVDWLGGEHALPRGVVEPGLPGEGLEPPALHLLREEAGGS